MRTAFIKTLCELAKTDERIWLLCGDLGYSVLESFAQNFPERFVNVGVAEQNMIGIATGLALSGKVVFIYSIANFPTLRCLEQIRNDICYHNANVKIVSVGAGFTYGSHGYTHHGIEDIAILRTLPNMTVIAPGDPLETELATRAMLNLDSPCYMRLGKAGEPIVHLTPPEFNIGKMIPVQTGKDALLISTGGMLPIAISTSQQALNHNLKIAVWSCPFISPIDEESVILAASQFTLIITLEEGTTKGGLGGSIAEIMAALPNRQSILIIQGTKDKIVSDAYSQKEIRDLMGLNLESIIKEIAKRVGNI
ncbi:transketolase [Sphaerospermopsis sp. FACHB-1094]|uniref:transketolase family protein n=1 Tax=Sphaerospermopsis sp. FACHB-1094 TaxID=2692861 RepID=UPI0016835B85|nr:transketolase C-terminal domain-containing protein [Sphaerospermopsis sp. FACHB-1094]MBD2134065.1 transketolase [Sphaerospermopsis sp. FACHB-1094]